MVSYVRRINKELKKSYVKLIYLNEEPVTTKNESPRGVLQERCSLKFRKTHREHLCQSVFINKVAGLRNLYKHLFYRTPLGNCFCRIPEAYLDFCQTSDMELFAKIVIDWKPLIILVKKLHLRSFKGLYIQG